MGFLARQSQDTWPSYMLPISPRANIPKEPDKSFVALSDPVLKVTQHPFCCILLATRRSLIHPGLEERRNRNYLLKRGMANNLQICFKISRQYIKFYRIACILSMEQYTRGIWKTLKRMKKLLILFCYYGRFFTYFIFGRKDGRKGNYIYNTDLTDSMFLLSNLCYIRELNLLTQVMEGFEGYKAERHSNGESDLKISRETIPIPNGTLSQLEED